MEQRMLKEREDPRVLRTRQLLLQAFSDLLLEKGFQGITVQDITERAKVNRSTFYTHFEDKYALLESWLRDQFQQHVTITVSITDRWNLDTFRTLIKNTVEWFAQLHTLTRSNDQPLLPLVVTTLQEALFDLLLQGFKTTINPGHDLPGDLETAALVTSWAIFGTGFQCFHQWEEPVMPMSSEDLANQATHVLVSGLAQTMPTLLLA